MALAPAGVDVVCPRGQHQGVARGAGHHIALGQVAGRAQGDRPGAARHEAADRQVAGAVSTVMPPADVDSVPMPVNWVATGAEVDGRGVARCRSAGRH